MFDGILAQFGLTVEDGENLLKENAEEALSDNDFLALELNKWLHSKWRHEMLDGVRYYRYEVEPLTRNKLWGKDADGCPMYVKEEFPLTIDNQYAKLVDQKTSYLLGKPFSLQTNNKTYMDWLTQIFDKTFQRSFQRLTVDAFNEGLAWIYPHYNDAGVLVFTVYPAHEVMPFWADDEHTQLDLALHTYVTVEYVDRTETYVQHVDVFKKDRVEHYTYSNGALRIDSERSDEVFSWGRVPLVAFKYNPQEIPLLRRVRPLQDNFNKMRSNWDKNMSETIMDNVLVLRNYGGENLKEFRDNLMHYGAVKVREDGGVEVLRLDRDAGSYIDYLKNTKQAIIENGRGFDAKDDRISSNPNEMNLRSMYSDIDLDADMMEQQYQAAFDQLLFFVDTYLQEAHAGNFFSDEVVFTFNRNMIVNDSEVISDIRESQGIVSQETLLAHHPFVSDVQSEMKKLDKEQQKQMGEMNPYPENFGSEGPTNEKQ